MRRLSPPWSFFLFDGEPLLTVRGLFTSQFNSSGLFFSRAPTLSFFSPRRHFIETDKTVDLPPPPGSVSRQRSKVPCPFFHRKHYFIPLATFDSKFLRSFLCLIRPTPEQFGKVLPFPLSGLSQPQYSLLLVFFPPPPRVNPSFHPSEFCPFLFFWGQGSHRAI